MRWPVVIEKWLGVVGKTAILIMLLALNAGLGMDDLVQRTFQLRHD